MLNFKEIKYMNRWYLLTLEDGRECAVKHKGILGNNFSVMWYNLDDKTPEIQEFPANLKYDERTSLLTFCQKDGVEITEKPKSVINKLDGKDDAYKTIQSNFELKKKEKYEEEQRIKAEEEARLKAEKEAREKARIEEERRRAEYIKQNNYDKYYELSRNLFSYTRVTAGECIVYNTPNQLQQSLGYTSVPTRSYRRDSTTEKGSLDFLVDILNDCVDSTETTSKIPFDEKEALLSLQSKVYSVCPREKRFGKSYSLTQEEFNQKMQESQTFSIDLENIFVSFCQYTKTNNIPLEKLLYRKTDTYDHYEDTTEITYTVPDTFKTLCKGIGKYISNTRGIEACKQFAEKIGNMCEIPPTDIIPDESKKTEIDD